MSEEPKIPASVPSIPSEHLDLVWMSPEFMQASVDSRMAKAEQLIGAALPAGWPDDETRYWFGRRIERMEVDPRTSALAHSGDATQE